jgi:hypothetical protein
MILFQILLPLVAPMVDLFALYGLIFGDAAPVLAFWLGFNLLQLELSSPEFRTVEPLSQATASRRARNGRWEDGRPHRR